jgi:hypothetical protein
MTTRQPKALLEMLGILDETIYDCRSDIWLRYCDGKLTDDDIRTLLAVINALDDIRTAIDTTREQLLAQSLARQDEISA